MIDVQNSPDTRGIPLQHVGVRDIRYPIKVLDKVNEFQHTIGSFNLYVHLTADFKGTHMSRFIEILNHYRHEIDINNLDQILEEMKKKLNSEAAHIDVTFPYFIKMIIFTTKYHPNRKRSSFSIINNKISRTINRTKIHKNPLNISIFITQFKRTH